jgi:LysM repeat protein
MPPRNPVGLCLLLLVPALLALAACGGDDDDGGTFQPGRLTDPERVPTATPWEIPPDVVILDPDNISPLPPDNPNTGEPSPTTEPEPGEPGICGDTYTVISGDTVFGIAEKCGVDAQAIIDANPQVENPASLSVGDVLNMPAAEGESEGDGESEEGQ